METILASAFLSLSTNIDNFAIGVAYSVRKLAISWQANLLIAGLSGISTFTAMSCGDWIEQYLTPAIAHLLGSGIFIVIGLHSVWTTLQAQLNRVEVDNYLNQASSLASTIDLREALLLGLSLTITNLGTGIGAGIAHLDQGLTSCLSFLSSLLMIRGGSFLGKLIERSGLEIVSGVLLIGLGLYEYWA